MMRPNSRATAHGRAGCYREVELMTLFVSHKNKSSYPFVGAIIPDLSGRFTVMLHHRTPEIPLYMRYASLPSIQVE